MKKLFKIRKFYSFVRVHDVDIGEQTRAEWLAERVDQDARAHGQRQHLSHFPVVKNI